MPQPPVEQHWKEAIRYLAAGPLRRTTAQILDHLRQQAARDPQWGAAPSDRTIRRVIEAFPEGERARYQLLNWPETMRAGVMEWAASRACMELIYRLDAGLDEVAPTTEIEREIAAQMGNDLDLLAAGKARLARDAARPGIRPLLIVAEWYWRVTQALSDDAPFSKRYHYAKRLAGAELLDDDEDRRRVEREIAYGSWRFDLDPAKDGRLITMGEILITALQEGELR